MKNNEDLKDKAIEYGIEIAKKLLLSYISSKFSKNNKGSKEVKSVEVKPVVVEKKKKRKISGLIKKTLIIYGFKELVYDRLKAKYTHSPDTKDYSWLFDYPAGKNIIDMPELINDIKSEDKIIDLGCGLGYFAIEVAKIVTKGKAYCVDQDINMLKKAQTSIQEIGIENIEIHRAYIEKLPFEDNFFDKAYLNITVGQLKDKAKTFLEIKRVLKEGGQLIVTDILLDDYYCLSSTIVQMANSCNFKAVSEKGNFLGYTLVFSK